MSISKAYTRSYKRGREREREREREKVGTCSSGEGEKDWFINQVHNCLCAEREREKERREGQRE